MDFSRPPRISASIWRRAVVVGLLYFTGAALTIRFTRFDGGTAFLWVSGAVLIAELSLERTRHWRPTVATCFVAGLAASLLYGPGGPATPLLAMLGVGEAVVAVAAMRRLNRRGFDFGSLTSVTLFAAAAGIIAPALGAVGGAAIVAGVTHMPYWPNLLHWYVGHALGNITCAPIMVMLLGGELAERIVGSGWRRRVEGAALVALMAGVTVAVFGQTMFPVLFLPLLPMIIAAFRFGRLGGAVAIVILAGVGGVLTLHGEGPVFLVHGDVGVRALFFQFYLAVATLMTLPVAAELSRRQALFVELRESEARYRLIADESTDVVLSLAPDGTINYVSPSIAELGGYDPATLPGSNATALVIAEDRRRVQAVHAKALATPDATFIVEYRAQAADGAIIWCETHTRGVTSEDGRVVGVVSAIRDISRHKSVEAELSRAASTDPLTGLVNRRAFDAVLDGRIAEVRAGRGHGCCALLDLDFFKQVNDRHGHDAGDQVLRQFAAAASGALRESDLIARLGGEEFGVILWGATLAEAHRVCDRLRQQIADLPMTGGDGRPIRITVSGGIATIDGDRSRATILREADDALYRAKNAGRNRLALAA